MFNRRKYYWLRDPGSEAHGGAKATRDTYAILNELGWIPFDTSARRKGISGVMEIALIVARLLWMPRGTRFFIQLPAYGPFNKLLSHFMVIWFEAVSLVHDIDEIRKTDSRSTGMELISKSAFVISTGLLLQAPKRAFNANRVAKLLTWDYLLAPEFRAPNWDPEGAVLFAGNCSSLKNGWIYSGCDLSRIHFYGIKMDLLRFAITGGTYHGPFSSDAPVFSETFAFGLVWEGLKTSSAVAPADDYERFNQPHKLSLYLSCGLPVLVWANAAAASFVRDEGCGLLIDSVEDLAATLKAVSSQEKSRMRDRAIVVGARLRRGCNLRASIDGLGLGF